jgi:hypothetical protein
VGWIMVIAPLPAILFSHKQWDAAPQSFYPTISQRRTPVTSIFVANPSKAGNC